VTGIAHSSPPPDADDVHGVDDATDALIALGLFVLV